MNREAKAELAEMEKRRRLWLWLWSCAAHWESLFRGRVGRYHGCNDSFGARKSKWIFPNSLPIFQPTESKKEPVGSCGPKAHTIPAMGVAQGWYSGGPLALNSAIGCSEPNATWGLIYPSGLCAALPHSNAGPPVRTGGPARPEKTL